MGSGDIFHHRLRESEGKESGNCKGVETWKKGNRVSQINKQMSRKLHRFLFMEYD